MMIICYYVYLPFWYTLSLFGHNLNKMCSKYENLLVPAIRNRKCRHDFEYILLSAKKISLPSPKELHIRYGSNDMEFVSCLFAYPTCITLLKLVVWS